MSFQMTAEVFDASWFSLVESTTSSPATGIKINIDGTNNYQAQSTFRFTDETASKDASLSDLVLSTGEQDEINPENSTYKEYELTPTFDKDIIDYELTLREYIDKMDITVIKNDENASMKLKVPKRDENNELVYDTDGVTILYEEKDIESNTPYEVILNKLGEPDTHITVVVTAEDGVTKNGYNIVIKRPYGTIKGNVYTEPTKTTTQKYIADVKVYKTSDTQEIIDWETVINDNSAGISDNVNESLNTITEIAKQTTEDSGAYEIYLIPGEYDILIDKEGYLDGIFINVTVTEAGTIDFGQTTLIPGDINKDGIVEILDKVIMAKQNGKSEIDPEFNSACDLNDDGTIEILDKTILTKNNGQKRVIINYKGGNT